jgi:molybdopterin-biosynthesis enzyme MoeA-like protein
MPPTVSPAAPDATAPATRPPTIGLVIVGDEILSGKRADKHFAKVVELLAERGMALSWARYVGDDPARITADLRDAFAQAAEGAVVFSCGGIGATPDDHTRQCAAAALGRPLDLHPQAKDLITERMRDVAAEQGVPFEPDRADNVHRLQMGVFFQGAEIVPNPYNKIPGFALRHPLAADGAGGGGVYFVPGFPVMAWPMVAWVLDTHCRHLHRLAPREERSVIVFGSMEATLTPLMERIEADHPAIKVFSLPSVDHPQLGRHIELGVKGPVAAVPAAYADLRAGLDALGVSLGSELVR